MIDDINARYKRFEQSIWQMRKSVADLKRDWAAVQHSHPETARVLHQQIEEHNDTLASLEYLAGYRDDREWSDVERMVKRVKGPIQ